MSPPRNIIMIQSDQHRGDWLGCAGARHVETPALDGLAARGLRFSQATCTYPLCGPSRMSFLTGLHPFRNGLHTNEESLSSHQPTFAHALGLGGYRSVLCGRIHFCGPDQRHGFVERIMGDYNPSYAGGPRADLPDDLQKGSSNSRHAVMSAGTCESHYFLDYDEAVTCAAEDYLAKHAATNDPEPLALCVGYFMPHTPFAAPERHVARARELSVHMPEVWPTRSDLNHWERAWLAHQRIEDATPEQICEVRIQYAAMIMYLDERVERVLRAAESLPGETLVLYWSDHGEAAGDHGLIAKGCLDQTSLHVPLLIAPLRSGACGMTDPGRSWDHPVSLVDLTPTLCEVSESPMPPDMDGASLLPILRGQADATWWAERPVFAEVSILPHLPPARMVRRGRFKYCYYHDDRDTLFDLEADPSEQINLLGGIDPSERANPFQESEYAAIARELRALVLQEWDPVALHADCRRAWRRLHFNKQWGETIGRRLWGLMDVWPGVFADATHGGK